MTQWGATTLGVMAIGLMANTAEAGPVEPALWLCDGEVKVNALPITCGGSEVNLKANDVVELIRGNALLTGWTGERITLEPHKPVQIEPRPAPPTSRSILARLALVADLVFGGAKRSALMKSKDRKVVAPVQPKLVAPGSLVMTEWKGVVRWQLPKGAIMALRVRLPAGGFIGKPLLLTDPSIDLATLGLGAADAITLELLILDTPPAETANYLTLPASAALRQVGRPVLEVVSTDLQRVTPERRLVIENSLKSLGETGLVEQAAIFLAAGELTRARDALQKVAPDGLPDAWARAVSGVRVDAAP